MRIAWMLMFAAVPLAAQEGHGFTPAELQRGAQLFLTKCSGCHGPDGDAVAGVNLASNRFRRAQTDPQLIDLIKQGIPGTPMPPGVYTDDEASVIVGYLHTMATAPKSTAGPRLTGDAARGKSVVEGKGQCLNCHRIGSAGSVTGPDLTGIGGSRTPTTIELSLTEPDAEIRLDNRSVRAVTKDGTVIRGTLLNQDTYSLQLLDSKAKLVSLQKDKLREFELMKTSAMPGYKDKLTAQELADAVSYLLTLKIPGQAPPGPGRGRGPR